MRASVATCHGCPLYKEATQAVFGVGTAHARVMLIGEQPGDSEDLAVEPWLDGELAAVEPAHARSSSPI